MKSIEDLRAELEELKARSAVPALTDEEEERAALRSEMAKAQAKIDAAAKRARDARDDETFAELEAKHAGVDLHRIDTEHGGMIVMRTPSVAKSRHFQQIALKGKLALDAIEDFVKPCVVHPAPDELEERLDKFPLLAATLCQFAQELGSDDAKRRTGK